MAAAGAGDDDVISTWVEVDQKGIAGRNRVQTDLSLADRGEGEAGDVSSKKVADAGDGFFAGIAVNGFGLDFRAAMSGGFDAGVKEHGHPVKCFELGSALENENGELPDAKWRGVFG